MNEQYIGNKLKSLRRSIDMRQSDLAEALSVSTSTISHWEKSRRIPSIFELKRIADFFQIDISELIAPSEEMKRTSIPKTQDTSTVDRAKPIKSPQFALFLLFYSLTLALLMLTLFLNPLVGYVTYFFALTVYVILTITYLTHRIHCEKKALREPFLVTNMRQIYEQNTHNQKVIREKPIIMSLIVVSFITLFLFYAFSISSIFESPAFAIFPFIVTLVAIVAITLKMLVYHLILNKNPFVFALSPKDKRLVKCHHIIHYMMLIDSFPILILIFFFLFYQLSLSTSSMIWIAVFGLMTFLIDLYVICRYQQFVDGFDLVNRNNGSSSKEDSEDLA